MIKYLQSQIENMKMEVVSYVKARNIKRKYPIGVSVLIIIGVIIFTTFSFSDPSNGIWAKILVMSGGSLTVLLLALVIYILSGEIPRLPSQKKIKIQQHLTRPIVLYYANSRLIEEIYQQYFKGELTKKQVERHREVEGKTHATSGAAGVGISGKSTYIDKGELDISSSKMVGEFLPIAIKAGHVLFDIEDAEPDLTEESKFDNLIGELENYIKLDDHQIYEGKKNVKQHALTKLFSNIKKDVSEISYVLIKCDFQIIAKKDKVTPTVQHL